jgi:hypothetical protein
MMDDVQKIGATSIDRTTGGDRSLNGMSVADVDDFRVDWFVRDLDGAGPSIALKNYGVGTLVSDVAPFRPGEFVQFWRHPGSGHSVIFTDGLKEGDEIVGIEYWSTQSSTDGVGCNSEYFGSRGSRIDPNLVFGARGGMPEDREGWREVVAAGHGAGSAAGGPGRGAAGLQRSMPFQATRVRASMRAASSGVRWFIQSEVVPARKKTSGRKWKVCGFVVSSSRMLSKRVRATTRAIATSASTRPGSRKSAMRRAWASGASTSSS